MKSFQQFANEVFQTNQKLENAIKADFNTPELINVIFCQATREINYKDYYYETTEIPSLKHRYGHFRCRNDHD